MSIQQQFDKYFCQIYGEDRWKANLLPALKAPTRYCCMVNKFADKIDVLSALKRHSQLVEYKQVEFITIPCLEITSNRKDIREFTVTGERFASPMKDIHNITVYYLLDAASVLMTEVLRIEPNIKVLDICAAPGGKSISIAQRLFNLSGLVSGSSSGNSGSRSDTSLLVSNEYNNERRKRLRNVLNDYLPTDIMERVRVTGIDGTGYSHFSNDGLLFDRVLVDAPCSSERHLLHNSYSQFNNDASELEWSSGKSRTMASRQVAILTEALKVTRVGGYVVYGTCSISPVENDDVVDKVMRKVVQVGVSCPSRKWLADRFPVGKPTKLGWIVLPDDNDCGYGPLYFSLLKRTS